MIENYAGRQVVGMDLHRRRSVLVRAARSRPVTVPASSAEDPGDDRVRLCRIEGQIRGSVTVCPDSVPTAWPAGALKTQGRSRHERSSSPIRCSR